MKSLSLTGRILAVVIAATFAFSGTALAASWVASTTLSLNASDRSVDKGDQVKFSGNLSSSRKKCRANQQVLLFKGNKKVASKRTSGSGHYSFTQKIKRTKTWHTEYKRHEYGTHPNVKVCLGTVSNGVRVEAH